MTDLTETMTPTEKPDESSTDYLAAYVGEGKKFKDVAELAKSYAHIEVHTTELKEKLDNRTAYEGKLDNILEFVKNKELPNNPPLEMGAGKKDETPVDVASLVSQELEKRQTQTTRSDNTKATKQALVEYYGSEQVASKMLAEVTRSENHKTVVNELAAIDPDAAVKFVTAMRPKADPTPTGGNPGMTGTKHGTGGNVILDGYITWSQAREMRKKNPLEYNGSSFRAKMAAAAAAYDAQGLNFFNT